ncbi:MAG: hypothetical protein LH624_15645 [Cryobacterium sp.]|nr:hypothetical protein [Cryobacterium sp.]
MTTDGSEARAAPTAQSLLLDGARIVEAALPASVVGTQVTVVGVRVTIDSGVVRIAEIVLADAPNFRVGITFWQSDVHEDWGSMIERVRSEFESWYPTTSFGWGKQLGSD